ncbi:MAG: hypothetical protein ACRD1T_06580 [Acidimicrobiia bacterium]
MRLRDRAEVLAPFFGLSAGALTISPVAQESVDPAQALDRFPSDRRGILIDLPLSSPYRANFITA